MDPYFSPILVSGLLMILLNTFIVIPIASAPLLIYFSGGVLASILFKNKTKDKEITIFDTSILGLGAGLFAGAVLTLIISIKLQDPQLKQQIIGLINEQMSMKSTEEFMGMDELGPIFMMVTGFVTIFICSVSSFFGSLCTMPFLHKKNK